ncbi:MAG TPA: OmpA family protein [Burkholderiaceae bacterium]|jgi:outer membrane protein OmpA-like peptidoglycan-associated protein|nr:OmpA family protein [Burkholderiaceae bacterium]HRA77605.1 OmpA family protein [Burkholderiaceae bacterium]
MATKKTLLACVVASVALAGCESMTDTQKRAAIGTGVGAVAGAALGSAVGGSGGATRTGAVLGAAAGGIGTYVWSKRMEDQKRAMEQATAGTGVGVSQTADNQLKLDIPSDISFDTNRADIKSNFQPVLDRFAQTLNANPATTVRIIGHTDSTGSDAINDPLSINRAANTRQYLASRGVDAGRVAIDGRGSHEPIADNNTTAGRAKNRRVEIYVAEAAPR